MSESVSSAVLVVDDEPGVLYVCREALEAAGFSVATASSPAEARRLLAVRDFGLVVTDVHLDAEDGVDLAGEVRLFWPGTDVIVMTGQPTVTTAVAAMKTGAVEFLQKPFSPCELARLALASVRRRGSARPPAVPEEVARAKGAVLALVSHELRTPLAVASMACELLGPRLEGKEERFLAERLSQGVGRLRERVEEILARAHGARPLSWASVPVGDLVSEATALCAAQAAARGARLSAAVDPGLELRCDARLMRLAFKELVSNAIRFGPAGGEVRVEARRGSEGLSVSFRDEGPGIPESERQRVFQPFYQAGDHMTRETGGLGLGLATVRAIVEAHGGSIAVLGPGVTLSFPG